MSNIRRDEIEDWFVDLINTARKKEQEGVLRYDLDLSSPCQIEAFCVMSPIVGQIYVVTGDQDRPDKEIIIHEFDEASNFLEGVKDVIDSDRWKQFESPPKHNIQNDKKSMRSDLLADPISKFIDEMESAVFSRLQKENLHLRHRDLWINGKYHIVLGNITRFDIETTIERYCTTYEDDSNSNKEANAYDSNTLQTLGGLIYKPVWIGDYPELSFETKVQGIDSIPYDLILNEEILGHEVFVYEHGLILFNEADQEKSQNILNTLFGIGLFQGYRSWKAISHREIVSAGVKDGYLNSVGFEKSAPSKRNQAMYPEDPRYDNRERIHVDVIDRIMQITEVIYPIHNLRDMITLHLQAHTHSLENKLRSSFVLNWVVIEQLIESLLTKNIEEEYRIDWENKELEYAAATDVITHPEYKALDSHRNKRNKIIHDMGSVSKVDVMELDALVSILIIRKINKHLTERNICAIDNSQLMGRLRLESN